MSISIRIIRKSAKTSKKPDNPDTRVRDRRNPSSSVFLLRDQSVVSCTPAYPVSPDFLGSLT